MTLFIINNNWTLALYVQTKGHKYVLIIMWNHIKVKPTDEFIDPNDIKLHYEFVFSDQWLQ